MATMHAGLKYVVSQKTLYSDPTNMINKSFHRNTQPPISFVPTTQKLQDLLLNQTSLNLVNSGGDLTYEGEIIEYYIAPITATSQNTAAQNRLTISINVRFFNKNSEEKGFEQRFSFYKDYTGQSLLTGSELDDALNEIFERITQDIFNKSLANW